MDDQYTRISRAQSAIKGYNSWGSYDEQIADLLADLMHYVDALRQDRELEDLDTTFEDLLDTAYMNYRAEIGETE